MRLGSRGAVVYSLRVIIDDVLIMKLLNIDTIYRDINTDTIDFDSS